MAKAKRGTKASARGGRPPADQVEHRREALLDAATQVFLESGFAGAKMSVIAKRAGSSMETLYARHPTKADLFAAIIRRKSSGLLDVIGPLSPEREPREALTSYGMELVAMMTQHDTQQLHRVVIAGSIEAPELGSLFWENGPGRGFQIVRTYLHEQMKRGTLRIDDPDRDSGVLLGMFVGGIVLRSTLGMPTVINTREAQHGWASYVVNAFLKTLS